MATIKQARSDLLQDMKVTANPISEEMEEGYLDQFKPDHVEGVGEPITATFLVEANMDPSKWYVSLITLVSYLSYTALGGCLRNTTECEPIGIPKRNCFIRGKEMSFPFPITSLLKCRLIFSWMGKYGMYKRKGGGGGKLN